jgi:hypothetical protein
MDGRMGHNRAPGALLDVDALCAELERLGFVWADEKAAYDALDDATKPVYADAYGRADGKTVKDREQAAHLDNAIKRHLDAKAAQRKKMLRARVAYDVQQVRVELTRSNASTERALATLR